MLLGSHDIDKRMAPKRPMSRNLSAAHLMPSGGDSHAAVLHSTTSGVSHAERDLNRTTLWHRVRLLSIKHMRLHYYSSASFVYKWLGMAKND